MSSLSTIDSQCQSRKLSHADGSPYVMEFRVTHQYFVIVLFSFAFLSRFSLRLTMRSVSMCILRSAKSPRQISLTQENVFAVS